MLLLYLWQWLLTGLLGGDASSANDAWQILDNLDPLNTIVTQ
jgi:hypothetical protein